MLERTCKIRCSRCGYFEDFSNGLIPPPVGSRPPVDGGGRPPPSRDPIGYPAVV